MWTAYYENFKRFRRVEQGNGWPYMSGIKLTVEVSSRLLTDD